MAEFEVALAEWIQQLSAGNVMPAGCAAIFIGLFEGERGYQVYISGSNAYDADDPDWACNDDFSPQPRYLETGIPGTVPWDQFQAQVVAAVRAILAADAPTILHEARHVSVGFDDGDLVNVV